MSSTGGNTLSSTIAPLSTTEADYLALIVAMRQPGVVDPLSIKHEIRAARDSEAVTDLLVRIADLLDAIEAEQGETP